MTPYFPQVKIEFGANNDYGSLAETNAIFLSNGTLALSIFNFRKTGVIPNPVSRQTENRSVL
jgi:hypothetical protein